MIVTTDDDDNDDGEGKGFKKCLLAHPDTEGKHHCCLVEVE